MRDCIANHNESEEPMTNKQSKRTVAMYQAKVNAAFDKALASGRLSHNANAANYVGNYMYMGRRADGRDGAFKHSLTRQYLA